MRNPQENLPPEKPSRAIARSNSDENLASWSSRDIDIAALRRWFIHRVALEAVKELNRERERRATMLPR